jgi:hypothetical protein
MLIKINISVHYYHASYILCCVTMGADSCNLQLEELEKVFYGIKYSTDCYHSLSSVHFAFAGVVGLILTRQDFWIFLVPC